MTSPSANKHKDQTERKEVSQSLSDSMSIYSWSFEQEGAKYIGNFIDRLSKYA